MKKILLLFLLLFPLIVKGETIYSDYELYIKDSLSQIETNDLISEEEIKYYVHTEQIISDEGYYNLNTNPSNLNNIDLSDYQITSRRLKYYYQDGWNRGNAFSVPSNITGNKIELINYSEDIKIKVFDQLTKELIPSTIENNIITLDKEYNLDQLYLIIYNTIEQKFKIKFNDLEYNITINNDYSNYNEILFTSDMPAFLRLTGIYTSAHFETREYYVKYEMMFKYYSFTTKEVIDTIDKNYTDIITKYNYYKRNKVVFNDYLQLDSEHDNVYSYIKESTINIDDIKYETNLDITKSGTYYITFNIFGNDYKKYIFVLNETICPVNEPKELTCEFEYQEKFTCDPKIIYVEYPVIYEKEIIKYKQLNITNKCNIKENNKVTITPKKNEVFSSLALFLTPLTIKLRKRIRSFVDYL